MSAAPALGLSLFVPPERIAAGAAAAEAAGLDEVWIGEDFFETGGIAGAALALGSTARVAVGVGVFSAVMRHPSLLAMELSALGRAHPGRLAAGIGLGDPAPLAAIGLLPDSPLRAVRECVTGVRSLLAGARSGDGPGIGLGYPARVAVLVGAAGPRMLRLAGEVGEGTVLSTGSGPEYVAWARRRLVEGHGGDLGDHRVTALCFISVARTTAAARAAIGGPLSSVLAKPVFRPMVRFSGLGPEAETAVAAGADGLERAFGPAWVDSFAVAGDPTTCIERIGALHRAGADCVVLCPWSGVPESEALLLDEVLPALR